MSKTNLMSESWLFNGDTNLYQLIVQVENAIKIGCVELKPK